MGAVSAVGAGLGLGQQWAQNPNIGFGGSGEHDLFSHLDPIGNAITKIGGDPLNLYGNKNNPNALLFPSNTNGQNGANGGVPSVLPNLGAQSMIPQMPQGGFMPLGQTNPMGGQTPGPFNQMAAQSAGQLFNPSLQAPSQIPFMSNGKGAVGGQGGINGGIVPPMGPSLHGPVGQFRGNLPTKAY